MTGRRTLREDRAEFASGEALEGAKIVGTSGDHPCIMALFGPRLSSFPTTESSRAEVLR